MDAAAGVAADEDGNVYVVGETAGDLDGTSAGESDAFIIKYDADGHRLWTRQFGSSARDAASGVGVDRDGFLAVSGITFGGLDGPNLGAYDAFVARFDPDGRRLWIKQVGTADRDYASSVATDPDGNVYIAGDTFGAIGGPNAGMADAYLATFDPSGRQLWARQLGSPQGDVARVAVDGRGNAYLTGQTDGELGGPNAGASDAFVAKYGADGERVWVRQLGGPKTDYALGVTTAADGEVSIAGLTDGDLAGANAGLTDVFVARFDGDGTPIWTRQFGTAEDDQATSVAADERGNVYVGGSTLGDLAAPSAGEGDAFLAKLGPDGAIGWVHQFGTVVNDIIRSVNAGSAGGPVIAGQTGGAIGDQSSGSFDGFVAAYP